MTDREHELCYWSARFAVPVEELRLTWRLYSLLNGGGALAAPSSKVSESGQSHAS